MEKTKILIVDDEEVIGTMLKINLERSGEFEVFSETKGAKALSAAQEFKPDLILLDMTMPDLGGIEVAQQIKSDDSLKNIPFIFLTGLANQEAVAQQDGVIAGYPFISKPVATKELISRIKKELHK